MSFPTVKWANMYHRAWWGRDSQRLRQDSWVNGRRLPEGPQHPGLLQEIWMLAIPCVPVERELEQGWVLSEEQMSLRAPTGPAK